MEGDRPDPAPNSDSVLEDNVSLRPQRNVRCRLTASCEGSGGPSVPPVALPRRGKHSIPGGIKTAHESWIDHFLSRDAKCYHDPDGTKVLGLTYDKWAPRSMPYPKGSVHGAQTTFVHAVEPKDFGYQPQGLFCNGRIVPDDEVARVGTMMFSITDLSIYCDLIDNFDQYRLDEIQVRFTSRNSRVKRVSHGLHVVVDRYNSKWEPADLRSSDKTMYVDVGQSLDIVFRPRLLNSGIFINATKYWDDPKQWTDLLEPTGHYGLRIVVPRPEYPQGDPDCCDYAWDVSARYKVSLRNK